MHVVYVNHVCLSLAYAQPKHFYRCLHDTDHDYAHRSRVRALRQQRLFAYACVYWLAQALQPVAHLTRRIERQKNGKPDFATLGAQAPLHFNLSHSGSWLSIALAHYPIGVDIETQHGATLTLPARQSCLHVSEPKAQVLGSDFLKYWTAKEALLKAQGMGLRIEPNRIALRPPQAQFASPAVLPEALQSDFYCVSLVDAPVDTHCAVALKTASPIQGARIQSKVWTRNALNALFN